MFYVIVRAIIYGQCYKRALTEGKWHPSSEFVCILTSQVPGVVLHVWWKLREEVVKRSFLLFRLIGTK